MIEQKDIEANVDDFVLQFIDANFKFRAGQKEEIIEILYNVLNEINSVHIVEAPTGSGKSLISIISAGVLSKYYNKRSYILASDLTLWDQYADFIKKHRKLDFGILKGKNNYKCSLNDEPIDSSACKLSGINMFQLSNPIIASKLGFPCAATCPYLKDRQKALKSNVTLMTYALYFNTVGFNAHDTQIQLFDNRDVVFCDECHNIPNLVQLAKTFEYKPSDVSIALGLYKYASNLCSDSLFMDDDSDMIGDYKTLIDKFPSEESIIDAYNDIFDNLTNFRNSKEQDFWLFDSMVKFWDLFSPVKHDIEESLKVKSKAHIRLNADEKKVLGLCRRHQSFVCNMNARQLLKIIDMLGQKDNVGYEYLVKSINNYDIQDKETSVTLQTVKEDYLIYMMLHQNTPVKVMLSATIGDRENFEDNIGIKYIAEEYVNSDKVYDGPIIDYIDSTFNFDKSPIHFINRYKMSMKYKDESLIHIKEMIYKICHKFNNNKGVIQTGNYAIAKYIVNNAPSDIKSRFLYYNGSKEKTDVIIKHQMSSNTILIGPTLNEGIDLPGDLCRFIIITKMPYPSLMDRLVDAKIKLFPYWYNSTTSNAIIQGIGRGNRYIDDWCETYILDACFLKLYTDTINQYPEYIQRRIKTYN